MIPSQVEINHHLPVAVRVDMFRSYLLILPVALSIGGTLHASPDCPNCGTAPTVNLVDGAAPLKERGLFESDHAFDGFIGPISNPVFSKDPRSLTEARMLFISNWIPGEHPAGSGDVQVYAMHRR